MSAAQPSATSRTPRHIDIYDALVCQLWTDRYGITDPQLRKAVQLAGSRVSMAAGYLDKPVP